MMYVVQPRLWREAIRCFSFQGLKEGEQADFSLSRVAMEIPFGSAMLLDDAAEGKPRKVTKAKPGDLVVIQAAQTFKIHNRICHIEAHPKLYSAGRPVFKRLYGPDQEAFAPMSWECYQPVDLASLPYLYEVYIVDEHLR